MHRLFLEFDAAITLAVRQRRRMDSAASAVSSFLTNHYDIPTDAVFIQGSYANQTAIEPLDGGEYDLDIVAVCAQGGDSAEAALDQLAGAFRSDGRFSDRVTTKKPCVRLEYAEDEVGRFHVDVVPTRPCRNGSAPLDAPRRDEGWHPTAPLEFTRWCEDRGVRFARTVKALKRWRDQNQAVRTAIKSIVLQVIVSEQMPDIPDDDVRLAETLRGLHRSLGQLTEPPAVVNPVLPSENLSARWTQEAFLEFVAELGEAVHWVDQALAATDLAEACDHWRELLGEDFPTPSKSDLGIRLGDTSHTASPESMGWHRAIRPDLHLRVTASIQRGRRSRHRRHLADDAAPILAGNKLRFQASGDLPVGSAVWWQVVNTGAHAREIPNGGLRGGLFVAKNPDGNPNSDKRVNWEDTAYTGSHLIRALAVLNEEVVAESDWFTVNIYAPGTPFRP